MLYNKYLKFYFENKIARNFKNIFEYYAFWNIEKCPIYVSEENFTGGRKKKEVIV